MNLRLGCVVLALWMTAFAPAPFPRPERRNQPEITLETFQGTWRVLKLEFSHSSGKHQSCAWDVTRIRVTKDRWEFITNNQVSRADLISINPMHKTAYLNIYDMENKNNLRGMALVRRHGANVQVIYRWISFKEAAGEKDRPTFDPPCEGAWIVTLQR